MTYFNIKIFVIVNVNFKLKWVSYEKLNVEVNIVLDGDSKHDWLIQYDIDIQMVSLR